MKKALEEHERINIMFKMENFEGRNPRAAWDDFINWPKIAAVNETAVVFDEKWDEFMSWLFKSYAFISHIYMKFFKEDRIDEAWEWLRSGK